MKRYNIAVQHWVYGAPCKVYILCNPLSRPMLPSCATISITIF